MELKIVLQPASRGIKPVAASLFRDDALSVFIQSMSETPLRKTLGEVDNVREDVLPKTQRDTRERHAPGGGT